MSTVETIPDAEEVARVLLRHPRMARKVMRLLLKGLNANKQVITPWKPRGDDWVRKYEGLTSMAAEVSHASENWMGRVYSKEGIILWDARGSDVWKLMVEADQLLHQADGNNEITLRARHEFPVGTEVATLGSRGKVLVAPWVLNHEFQMMVAIPDRPAPFDANPFDWRPSE